MSTPVLAGRLQTRLLLAVAIGIPVTLLVALLRDSLGAFAGLGAIAVYTGLGMGWEVGYQGLQQRRWERDWPRAIALATGLPEALLAWPVMTLTGLLGTADHFVLFASTWVAMWVAKQGPIQVFLPHWRHQGGRVIARHTPKPAVAAKPARAGHSTRAPRPAPNLAPVRMRQPVLVGLGFATVVLAAAILAPLLGTHSDKPATAAMKGAAMPPSRVDNARTRHTDWDTSARVQPVSIEIPGTSVSGSLGKVNLTSAGVLATPEGNQLAWYADGAAPGQRGPAVVVGSDETSFKGLLDAKLGQEFKVVRADGTAITFVIDDVQAVDADHFPTKRVYGATDGPQIRLIGYAKDGGNVIVFGHATSMLSRPA